ncbi:MAG: nucleotidyl transferase AbiEii/AbiGii toxin family protein, partial [Planctomycetaceae bacterium]
MNDAYQAQVRLMLDLLPLVAEETVFALKGGTAINFFVRNMPRLSVDIDLTYLPLDDRAATLAGITEGLTRI